MKKLQNYIWIVFIFLAVCAANAKGLPQELNFSINASNEGYWGAVGSCGNIIVPFNAEEISVYENNNAYLIEAIVPPQHITYSGIINKNGTVILPMSANRFKQDYLNYSLNYRGELQKITNLAPNEEASMKKLLYRTKKLVPKIPSSEIEIPQGHPLDTNSVSNLEMDENYSLSKYKNLAEPIIQNPNVKLISKSNNGFSTEYGLVDNNKNVILKPIYSYINETPNYNYIVENQEGKRGLFTADGQEVLPFEYNMIDPVMIPYGEHANYKKNVVIYILKDLDNKFKIIDGLGRVIVNQEYNEIKNKDKYFFALTERTNTPYDMFSITKMMHKKGYLIDKGENCEKLYSDYLVPENFRCKSFKKKMVVAKKQQKETQYNNIYKFLTQKKLDNTQSITIFDIVIFIIILILFAQFIKSTKTKI